MIKGVNRQIIEISETGNAYFERALLVVRPQCSDNTARLHEEANKLLMSSGSYSGLRRNRRRRLLGRIALVCSGGIGGLLIGILMRLAG